MSLKYPIKSCYKKSDGHSCVETSISRNGGRRVIYGVPSFINNHCLDKVNPVDKFIKLLEEERSDKLMIFTYWQRDKKTCVRFSFVINKEYRGGLDDISMCKLKHLFTILHSVVFTDKIAL